MIIKSTIKSEDFDFKDITEKIVAKMQIDSEKFLFMSSKHFFESLFLKKSFHQWQENDLERIEFHALIQISPNMAVKFMDIILEVLSFSVKLENDFITRFSALESFNILVLTLTQSEISEYSLGFLKDIIEPSLVWKMGSPNNKIRKASIICFEALITRQLIQR